MRNLAIRITVVAGAIGAFGLTGAAVASADTLVELDPNINAGAQCLVIEDDGSEELLYSSFFCSEAQAEIDEQQRIDDRREDRRDERREERLQNG